METPQRRYNLTAHIQLISQNSCTILVPYRTAITSSWGYFLTRRNLSNWTTFGEWWRCSQEQYPNHLAPYRIDSSSGGSSDPLNSGPTAQSVPTHALIVNNDSPEITFHNETGLRHIINDVRNYKGDISVLRTKGELLSYSFDGVAIWYEGVSHTIQ